MNPENPVPLTHEILLSFGLQQHVDKLWTLKRHKHQSVWYTFPDIKFLLYVAPEKQGIYFITSSKESGLMVIKKDIKFVHQLQSFYFAFTGKQIVRQNTEA